MVLQGKGFALGTIILDEPEAVYYSGQWVNGNVHFEITETISYSAINVVYLGEALVQQADKQYVKSGGTKRCREVNYDGYEQYINFVHCVSGGTGAISTLPSGVHAIPFKFQVPFEAPSSFEGEIGSISYSITAYLEYPEPGRREQLAKEFHVVAPISPNTLAKMTPPLLLDFEDIQTCKCFCAGKPVNLKVSLPSAALPVGAQVPLTVEINDTYAEIYEIHFKIMERHRYRTQTPRSEYTTPEEVLMEMRKGPLVLEQRRSYTWPLQLPPTLLPNLESSSIIDVAYFLKVQVKLTGCNNLLEEQAEVVIGVLPPSDKFAETAPEVAALLPKAPVPEWNNAGAIPPPQPYPPNTLSPGAIPLPQPYPPNTLSPGVIPPPQPYPPNTLSPGVIPPPQPHPPNTLSRQQYDPQVAPVTESAQSPYNIGFTNAEVPALPPYSAEPVRSGYPWAGAAPAAASSPYNPYLPGAPSAPPSAPPP